MTTQPTEETTTRSPLVVAIGASAGGLEAFQELLSALGDARHMALVFVQHLDPTTKSLLAELLAQKTPLEIVEIAERRRLQAGTVYICPPHTLLDLKHGFVSLAKVRGDVRVASPIDHFFHAVAEDQGEHGVGVILSGTGSDGTLGLQAISDRGGLTFAQEPSSAKCDSMPRSAATTGVADHVMTPVGIAAELLQYSQHLIESEESASGKQKRLDIKQAIPLIAERLMEITHHNFQHYKLNTLTRRIQRRLQVLKMVTVNEYLDFLQQHEEEVHALFRELLIGVTAFFRDPDAFDALKRKVLPRLFENRTSDDCVRIWVAGCANGAEAYTMAILCREVMDELDAPRCEFRIFATDIDERALSVARTGIYPVGIEEQVSPERLRRFFVKRGKRYHVTQEIRESVLFSLHNLISDPPFSRQDLISCRNLLIYLGPHLQNKLIPLFHYALRPSGYLFLGPSENITTHGELFRPLDAKQRISQRKGISMGASGATQYRPSPLVMRPGGQLEPDSGTDLNEIRQRITLDEFSPKSVVIDEHGQILNASPDMQTYLTVSGGNYHNNIIKMAARGLRLGLRTAIAEAKKNQRRVDHEDLSVRVGDHIQRVMVTVQPMPRLGEDEALYMVVFQDQGKPIKCDDASERVQASPAELADDAIVTQLESELEATRDNLDKTLQDMEAANEELKSSNEELLSMNEELQTANEELETSKEEIRASSDATARANADLENLLRSTQIATVFLDEQLSIRSFTPAIEEIYSLISTDVGRPLEKFVSNVANMPPLPDPNTLSDGESVEHTVETRSGKSFIRRVLPYRSHTGESEGIVVTFTDVTELQMARQDLENKQRQLQSITDAIPPMIAYIDQTMRFRFVNAAYAHHFELPVDRIVGKEVVDIIGPANFFEIERHLQEGLQGKRVTYVIDLQVPGNDDVLIKSVDCIPHCDADGSVVGVHVLATDITEQKRSEANFAFLAELERVVTEAGSTDRIYETALSLIAAHLNADTCLLVNIDEGVNTATVFAEHVGPAMQSFIGTYRLNEYYTDEERSRLVDNQQIVITDASERDPDRQAAMAALHIKALCNSSYVTEVGWRFTLSVLSDKRRRWREDELDVLKRATHRLCMRVERARTAEELISREAHLRRVIDNTLNFIGVLDVAGTLLEANATAIRAGGISREDVIGKKVWECFWWNFDEATASQLREAVVRAAAGEVVRYDAIVRMAGDTRMTIDFMLAPVFDDEGNVTYLIPSGFDISDRKVAEVTLRESETLVRTMAENSTQAMIMMDDRGYVTYCNQSFLEMVGFNEQEIRSRPLHDLIHHSHPDGSPYPMSDCPIDRALPEDFSIRAHEDLFFRKDGSSFPVMCAASPIFRDGVPVSTVIEVRDITEQKQWSQEITEREAHLRRVINNQLGLVGLIDREGKLLEVDDRSLQIAGLNRDDVIGKHFAECAWWTYDETVAQKIRETMERALAGETVRYDVPLYGAGLGGPDERLMIDFMMAPVRDIEGNVEFLIQSGVDISDRKQAEEAVVQREERLRFALDSGGMGLWEWNINSDHITWSDQMYSMFGYSPDTFNASKSGFLEITHPHDRPMLERLLKSALAGTCRTHEVEFRVQHGQNDCFVWTHCRGTVRRDDVGNALSIISIAMDMTQRKQQELNLKFIAEVQDDFNQVTHSDELIQSVPLRLYNFFNLNRCTLVDYFEDQLEVEVVRDQCAADLPTATGRYLVTEFITEKELALLIDNQPVIFNDTQDASLPAKEAARMAAFGCHALVIIPYLSSNRLAGMLTVSKSTPHVWKDSEINLLTDFTTRFFLRLARARAEDQLALTQSRLAMAMEVARMGSFEWEPDTDVAKWDDPWCEAVGMPKDMERTGSNLFALVHPDDVSIFREAIERSRQNHSDYRAQYRIIRPDNGEVRWLAGSGKWLDESTGRPKRLVGLNWDITQQKDLEQQIRNSEQRFRLAVSAANLSMWEWDVRQDRIYWSDDLYNKQRSASQESLGGLDVFLDLIHPDDRKHVTHAIQTSLSDGSPYHAEFRMRRSDGSYRWLMAMATLTLDDEQPMRMIGVELDISARKETELAVRLSEERLRSAAEAAGFGMVHADLITKTVTYSGELRRLLGLANDADKQLRLGEMPDWVHPDDKEAYDQFYQRLMTLPEGETESLDHRITHSAGKVHWIRLLAKLLYSGEGHLRRPTQLIGTVIDITQQREFEQSLQEARELAVAANESKSAFLANMSHEIRTPMTAILGYADLIRDKIDEPEARGYLQTIRRNGDYLLEIINDILDLSKIEAGKFDIQNERFEPVKLIEDVRSIMEVRATEGGLALDVEYDGKMPKVIESDAKRLKQILINLVGNAIKFTKHGRVCIRVRYESGAGDKPAANPRLHFEIVDTGIGMTVEQMGRLFKPFSQGDTSVSRHFGGTGLGLAISKRLAEMLGGKIGVCSTQGVGSTFSVSIATGKIQQGQVLEYAKSPKASPPVPSIALEPVSLNCRVLVVDDRRDIRFLSKHLLTQAGAAVDECEDGQIAVEHIAACLETPNCPDLILLDMQMPNLDGYQTARALRKLGYNGPIIALTADAMQGDMNECLEAGCNDYLSKPIDKAAMLQKIAELISLERDK